MIKEALKRETFEKAFVLSKLSERMPDNQMKAVLGGYGGYDECCWCSWFLEYEDGGTNSGSGIFCGSLGSSDPCGDAHNAFCIQQYGLSGGDENGDLVYCNTQCHN